MKLCLFGLHRGSNVDPDRLTARAISAEAAGFESAWVGDHLALPVDAPDPADEPRLEAVVALTFIAAVTKRLRLGVGVLILPQRHPVLLAKQVTSLDLLSRGRLDVGIGVGFLRGELAAFGVNMADRGRRADEFLQIMRLLWQGEPVDYEGEGIRLRQILQYPQPRQLPHPPIIVGGHSPAALRRAAIYGDGWFGWQLSPNETSKLVTKLERERAAVSADLKPLEISVAVMGDNITRSTVDSYVEAGVDRIAVLPTRADDHSIEALIESVGSSGAATWN